MNTVSNILKIPYPHRFSKWNELLNGVLILRLIDNCKSRTKFSGVLTVAEIQDTESLFHRRSGRFLSI